MAFKRRLKFDKRIKHKKRMDRLFILVIVCFAFLGIGYSYISTSLNINGTANVTAASWDVHFDNLNVTTGSVTATTPADITSDTTVEFAATLEEPGDFYEFTVDVENGGTMDAMIDDFGISPELTSDQQKYLEYTITYSDGVELEEKQELKQGTTETLKVRFSYIENEDKTNYPTEDQTFNIEFTVTYTQANEDAIVLDHSFNGHSWGVIIANVRSGNTDIYNIGDTKEIDMGTFGTHTLRVANKSTPTECSTAGFSQTACGFVLEFTDLITEYRMNPYNPSSLAAVNGNKGGWPASQMRTYINSDIYDALPSELKNGIIDTIVVSGHGNTTGETNFTSTDKMYLPSTKEMYGKEGTTNIIDEDTAEAETRQLDYYNSQNLTTSNYAGAIKKYNESNVYWWLRSAQSTNDARFYYVGTDGNCTTSNSPTPRGVSPAFRIG